MSFAVPRGATLVQSVGAGSTFEVAVVERAGSRFVCKRLAPRMRAEPAARGALEREVVLLGRVRHPALPDLVEAGDDEHGPFVIETLVEAPSLRRVVSGYHERGRTMAPPLFRAIVRAGFSALAELHALGEELVLGDVGPDHVLAARGRVYFVDFGQSRYRGMPSAPSPNERGTLPYAAPELARCECEPSQATDVYSLAASFAFLALGREPCRAEVAAALLVEVAERGLDLEALSTSTSLDAASRDALMDALRFAPAERLRDAAAMVARLDA